MRIDVYADVLCPWCYIAKRRLAQVPGIDVVWRSLELSPAQSRVPGVTAAEAMREWWGERAPERVAHIRAVGAADGLDLDLDRARPVNTFDAHRLIHLGADRGMADAVAERLLHGYHTEGRNVADHQVLLQLGVAAGLDGREVAEVLAGDGYGERVRDDERRAAELGVTGVPTMIVGGRPVSALQPPDVLARLLELAPR